ncbi:MAG: hypothetical protein LBE76_00805 [Nitrososphaerota archaeon]|nr:hypothetical protein [Nitrososphaerota archaeon]
MDFGTKKASPPIRDVATKTIYTLRLQQHKLEQACARLKERDRRLFETCVLESKRNNRERAAVFATELTEVRRMGQLVYHMQLNIEGVILRLETLRELSDVVVDLRPALKLLQDASSGLFKVLPDVSAELSNVTNTIQETLNITQLRSDDSIIPVGHKTEGGEEILKEVTAFMEHKLNQDLPVPPTSPPVSTVKAPSAPVKERVALTASGGSFGGVDDDESEFDVSKTLISFKTEVKEITMVKQSVSKQRTLEEVLYDYVIKRNGDIDLSKCSSELNVTNTEIERALESLGSQGKIKLELKSPE